jgi:hypothetical protein
MAKPDSDETGEELDYQDGWHWTTDAAHYNPDDIPRSP